MACSYEAAVLSTDPASGSITTRQPRTRSRILELRDNPRYAAALAAERINRARIALAQSLGRPVGRPTSIWCTCSARPGRSASSRRWTARRPSPRPISSPPTAWR